MTTTEVPALYTLDGTLASAYWSYGKWGAVWVLTDKATAAYGKRLVRPSVAVKPETRARHMRAKGFTVGVVMVPLRVTLTESGARIAITAD